jgi:hypothetical protein
MKRTQLYLDEDLWNLLHVIARQSGTTISDLARTAIREKYSRSAESRNQAMEAVIGLWKDRTGLGETGEYVRRLRRGSRLERVTR